MQAPLNPIGFYKKSKMIQLRLCWSSCSAFVFPFDIMTTRCFEDIARWIFQSRLENTAGTPIAVMSLQEVIR